MSAKFSIIWKNPPKGGFLSITNQGSFHMTGGDSAPFELQNGNRLDLEISGANTKPGPFATVVNLRVESGSFSFFLRDVSARHPIYIPQYAVMVTQLSDRRPYEEIERAILEGGRKTRLEAIEARAEMSYEEAAKIARDIKCPTWLGVSRDIRIFEVSFQTMRAANEIWDSVRPRYHGTEVFLPELGGNPVRYDYFCGRGIGCTLQRERWLERGTLPIVAARLMDDGVRYEYNIFTTLEKSTLSMENIKGTHYLVADRYSDGCTQTEEESRQSEALIPGELELDEEVVCYIRIQAVNDTDAPKYCYVRIPQPNVNHIPELLKVDTQFDGETGFGTYSPQRVFLVAELNDAPVSATEMSVLLMPGEKAEYVFKIPHRPISTERAKALARVSFDEKLNECIRFWETKLASMAEVNLPEKRIQNMMRAGMLHLDITCYGNEKDGPLSPTVGAYGSIGSESAPIILFMDSMGLHNLARRSIMYFIEKQWENGFIQNFGGYMLETGCVLWVVGEHFRYTRDEAWIRSIRDNIIRGVEFIFDWRERNKLDKLRGCGFGMLDGKVADPEDQHRIFMLNSTACIGVLRAGEVLGAIGDPLANEIRAEAEAFRRDIRASFTAALESAPVMPLMSGAWCPSLPAWAEYPGSVCLYTMGGEFFTHGSFLVRDTLLASTYLMLNEIIDPVGVQADFMLNCLSDSFLLINTAFSQPYYSTHPWAHLRRGEVKAFLMEFYMGMSSLADRETYTFWEHSFMNSPHKTHEEAWFLMRCRYLLYLEVGDVLHILPGAPRAWLNDGERITLDGATCYFGPLSFSVTSNISSGTIAVRVKIDAAPGRLPRDLVVRLPHPETRKAQRASAGEYLPEEEAVVIHGFTGETAFELQF